MNRKIYNENMVRVSTLLAGPFACAYLMAQNYKTLGDEKRARRTLLYGGLITILVFGSLILLPDAVLDKVPNFLLPVVFAATAQLLVRKYQLPELELFLTSGGGKHSNWKVAGVSLVVLALEIAAAAVIIFTGVLLFE